MTNKENDRSDLEKTNSMKGRLKTITKSQSTFHKNRLNGLKIDPVSPLIVGLTETAEGTVERYTTTEVLQQEGEILDMAETLAFSRRHELPEKSFNALRSYSRLNSEQQEAVKSSTKGQGLSIITGEAGTGKTAVLSSIQQAYADAGYQVRGMSWTNDITQQLKGAGFEDVRTIASELAGRSDWTDKTLVVVDEASLVPDNALHGLLDRAKTAGAKIVLVGDHKQLPSIDRGAMLDILSKWYGTSELHQVLRVSDPDQKQAFNHMHEHRFSEALEIFEKKEAIHWASGTDNARDMLVAEWTEDWRKYPNQSRFTFAYTNAEVDALNDRLRTQSRELGLLKGPDVKFDTSWKKDTPFAVGDRIRFTENSRELSIYNGRLGTIKSLEAKKIEVTDDLSQVISFDPKKFNAFRHAYAGTVHCGQGKTFDRTYLLHSKLWTAPLSYVALTRHKEDTKLFVDQKSFRGIPELAEQMARSVENRAASQFHRELDNNLIEGIARLSLQDQNILETPDPVAETDLNPASQLKRKRDIEDEGLSVRPRKIARIASRINGGRERELERDGTENNLPPTGGVANLKRAREATTSTGNATQPRPNISTQQSAPALTSADRPEDGYSGSAERIRSTVQTGSKRKREDGSEDTHIQRSDGSRELDKRSRTSGIGI